MISGHKGPGKGMKQTVPGGKGSGLTASWYHVEGHAIALMRKYKLNFAELFINRTPCWYPPARCMSVIHKLLPPGCRLRVHFPRPDGSVGIVDIVGGVDDYFIIQ